MSAFEKLLASQPPVASQVDKRPLAEKLASEMEAVASVQLKQIEKQRKMAEKWVATANASPILSSIFCTRDGFTLTNLDNAFSTYRGLSGYVEKHLKDEYIDKAVNFEYRQSTETSRQEMREQIRGQTSNGPKNDTINGKICEYVVRDFISETGGPHAAVDDSVSEHHVWKSDLQYGALGLVDVEVKSTQMDLHPYGASWVINVASANGEINGHCIPFIKNRDVYEDGNEIICYKSKVPASRTVFSGCVVDWARKVVQIRAFADGDYLIVNRCFKNTSAKHLRGIKKAFYEKDLLHICGKHHSVIDPDDWSTWSDKSTNWK